MQLIRTNEDEVSRLALVRAMRGSSHASLARQLGVKPVDILTWEREGKVPSAAMAKRAGLALRWAWSDFLLAPVEHEKAWANLLTARQASRAE